jgi:hypothetical protein
VGKAQIDRHSDKRQVSVTAFRCLAQNNEELGIRNEEYKEQVANTKSKGRF